MYESVNINFDDIGCTWNAGHVFCMIFSTCVANRGRKKSAQIAMESDIVLNTTYKIHIKNVRIFDHEKNLD